jgi:hypothetical protein
LKSKRKAGLSAPPPPRLETRFHFRDLLLCLDTLPLRQACAQFDPGEPDALTQFVFSLKMAAIFDLTWGNLL